MTPGKQVTRLFGAAACAALLSTPLSAATIFWQGGSGVLTGANYSTGVTPNVTPTAGDVVNFGGGGIATHSLAGTTSFQKLRVGHNQTTPAPGGGGTGTVTINNGAAVNLTVGAPGAADASLWVGNVQNGILNIDGAGTSVTSARLVVVGYGNNVGRTGTINITSGGSLTATQGNILLGEGTGATPNGVQGHMFVDGSVSAPDPGADLNIGFRAATSTFTQTGGTVAINDVIEVGGNSSTSSNSSFSISGGATTHGGSLFVGRGATSGATVNISGTGVLNTGTRFLMGGGTSTGVTTNHTGGTLNITLDLRVADLGTGDSTYKLSGMGIINSTTGGFVGRQGTGKFLQSGGQANFNGALSIGNRNGEANPTNGLYEISAGIANITTLPGVNALNIAPNGTGEFRVVGDDGAVNVTGNMLVNNTANGLGKLAYQLETGDLLSTINVVGTATFSAGSSLVFDATNAAPTQTVYDLLTATSIVDTGIAFTAPPSWIYKIISGGNGQILQAVYIPEPSALGLALVAGGLLMVRRRVR